MRMPHSGQYHIHLIERTYSPRLLNLPLRAMGSAIEVLQVDQGAQFHKRVANE